MCDIARLIVGSDVLVSFAALRVVSRSISRNPHGQQASSAPRGGSGGNGGGTGRGSHDFSPPPSETRDSSGGGGSSNIPPAVSCTPSSSPSSSALPGLVSEEGVPLKHYKRCVSYRCSLRFVTGPLGRLCIMLMLCRREAEGMLLSRISPRASFTRAR